MSTAEKSRTKSVVMAMDRRENDRRTCPRCGRRHTPKLLVGHPHRLYCRDCRETDPLLVNGWDPDEKPEQVRVLRLCVVRWFHGNPTLAIRDRHH